MNFVPPLALNPRRTQTLYGPNRIEIDPTPPYSFQGSIIKPSHFRTADCAVQGLTLRQTVLVDGRRFGVRITGRGDLWHPRVVVSVYGERGTSSVQLTQLADLLRRRLDMETDVSPFFDLARRTPRGRATILRWMGSRPTCMYSLYELLVVLICLQNTHVRRTESMMQRLFESFGRRVSFDRRLLWSFWEPRALVSQEKRLRELRLGYRARSLETLSRFFSSADRDFEDRLAGLPDAELTSALQEIPGVGPATAGGLIFDYFHRYDALTYLPPWETKIFRRLLHEPHGSAAKLVGFAHRTWPGYSRLALHILFEDQFWRLRDGRPNILAGLAPP